MTDEQLTLNSAAHDYFQALPGLKYPQALVDLFPRMQTNFFHSKTTSLHYTITLKPLSGINAAGDTAFSLAC